MDDVFLWALGVATQEGRADELAHSFQLYDREAATLA
jgi:hypothetical protein